MTAWTHAGPSIAAAFGASLVEFVEALTVILAIGSVRGWRDALAGSAAAFAVLLLIIAVLGSALTRIPIGIMQMAVGTLLLLFGMRWLRKAMLRAAGSIALRDEAAAFTRQREAMGGFGPPAGWDRIAFAAAFQIVMLEGAEVAFIVVAIGAGGAGLMLPAMVGAAAALLVVVALGLALHRPLARIPENSLKFLVGVLLSAFGTFWVGEGMGIAWPGADWSLLALAAGFLGVSLTTARLCRVRATGAASAVKGRAA